MIEIRRILCPVDLSEASRHALEHAVAAAQWFEAPVTVLHVIHPTLLLEPPVLFAEPASRTGMPPPDREAVEARLRTWIEPSAREGVAFDVRIDDGDPAARIVEHARMPDVGLAVLGTHGLSGFERLILGSVAEKVLRRAPCPVMTVPPAVAAAATLPYRRLLCPVDFSDSSIAALNLAFLFAQEADAQLTVLHVLDWPPDEELLVEQFDEPGFRRALELRIRRKLDGLIPTDVRTWCDPAVKIVYGKPYRQILAVADAEHADLIVIGVRGRHPLDLALFGSTTNQVVRHATCPVLTVKQ